MIKMDMTAISILNNPAATLYNSLDSIETSSRRFFEVYFDELEAFMGKNKTVIRKIREIRRNYFELLYRLSQEHPEAHKLYAAFLNAQDSGNTKEEKKLGNKIDALMKKSHAVNDSMDKILLAYHKFFEEPVASNLKEIEKLMQVPINEVLDICEKNLADLEGTEKCVYFIFIGLSAFLFDPKLSERFSNWLVSISGIYGSSPMIQLLYAFVIITMLPTAEKLNLTKFENRDAAYVRLYNSIKKDPEISSRALWKNLELAINNTYKENIFEDLASFVSNEIEINRIRPMWISFNISFTSFLIFYFQKLTNYDITQNLKQIQKSLEHARSLDPQNPVANLIYAFTLIEDENGITAEKLFKESISQFATYKIKMSEHFIAEMKSLTYIGLATAHNKRYVYDLAEKYYNEALSYAQTQFLKCIVFLNRGKNRLDQSRITNAISDFNEAMKMPHTEALALTNLGKLYYNKGLFQKSESVLIEAIDKDSSLQNAYYNLGVLYNDEGKIEDAKKLFSTAWDLDRNFKEAREALIKINQIKKVEEKNFVVWWFKSPSVITNLLGALFLGFIIYFMGQAINLTYHEKSVSNSIWIGLGVSMAFFLIPFLTKIKIGDVVELEMTSVTT